MSQEIYDQPDPADQDVEKFASAVKKRRGVTKNKTIEEVVHRKRKPAKPKTELVINVDELPESVADANLDDMTKVPKWHIKQGRGRVLSRKVIESLWPQILLACQNGYTIQEISACLKISRKTFYQFLNQYPAKQAEMHRARFMLRDEMLDEIVKAAKSGKAWVAAAWVLERLFPQTFAKPEVKLQMYDRMINKDIVEQKIGGMGLDQIRKELEEKYKDNADARRFFGSAGQGSGEAGHNEPVPQPESGDAPEADS